MTEWADVQGGSNNRIWNFSDDPNEDNGVLVGRFDGTREITTKDNFAGGTRQSVLHDVTLETGETVSLWGAVDLDSKLAQVIEGDAVRIAYLGKEEVTTKAGITRKIKKYAVQRADGATLTIADPTPANGDGSDDDIPF